MIHPLAQIGSPLGDVRLMTERLITIEQYHFFGKLYLQPSASTAILAKLYVVVNIYPKNKTLHYYFGFTIFHKIDPTYEHIIWRHMLDLINIHTNRSTKTRYYQVKY